MKRARILAAIGLAAVLLGATGCVREPLPEGLRFEPYLGNRAGDTSRSDANAVTDEQTVELQGATKANVSLTMGVGELGVASAATSALAEAAFEYPDKSWAPVVDYTVADATGTLEISQPDIRVRPLDYRPNRWDIRLAKGVPMDLTVHVGAGTADLRLSEVDVRDVTLRLGAGETTLDLTGPRTENITGDIQAGVGQLIIKVPKDVGVRVSGRNGGIGSFEADSGFHVEGSAYVNDAYGTSPVTIDLSVLRGVGEVRLESQ